MRVRVIGVGTPRGDDAAGLVAAGRLERAPLPPGVEVATCERPAPDLLDAIAGAEAVVLLDATRSGRAPGTVHRPALADVVHGRRLSSHAFGVGEALALARALGRWPARLEIVAIEAGDEEGDTPSAAVRAGAERAAALARRIVLELCAGAGGSTDSRRDRASSAASRGRCAW